MRNLKVDLLLASVLFLILPSRFFLLMVEDDGEVEGRGKVDGVES